MSETNLYEKLTVKQDGADVEIEAEIPVAVVADQIKKVIANAKKDFEIPGFRKGQVPEELVQKHLNEMHVLEDAADLALREVYPQIVEDKKLPIVTAPRVTITKLAPGNPVAFKARVGVLPEFKLPDYKKIAKKIVEKEEAVAVTDAEVDDTIRNIQMMRLSPEEMKQDAKEAKLPELTDEYVKSLGRFESVADFKEQIKAGIKEEKETANRRKRREDIAEALIDATKMSLPTILVDEEVVLLRNRRFEDVQRMGVSMEDYLAKIQKTAEALEAEEKNYVERQLKTRFILEKIAEVEKIAPDEKMIEENAAYLMERNPNIDPERVRGYVTAMLSNEQVLELLEGKAPEKKPTNDASTSSDTPPSEN